MRKCSSCSEYNVTIETTAELTGNLTFASCDQFRHYMMYSQNAQITFLVDLEQVFYKSILVKNLCFTFFSSSLLHFFTRVTS